MSYFRIAIAAAAITFTGNIAAATTLGYDGPAGSSSIQITGTGITANNVNTSYGGTATAFKMSDAGNELGLGQSFIAFCLDLLGTLNNNADYEVTDTPFATKHTLSDYQVGNVKNLFNSSYGSVDTDDNIQAAAFQMALWDVLYEEDDADLGLDVGKVQGFGDDAVDGTDVTDLANSFLGNVAGYGGPALYKVSFLEATNDARQDLVTAQLAPVPVPAAGLLLIGGFGALAAMKRRKEKRAA